MRAAARLFTRCVSLEHGYWPAVGDLFHDGAQIKNVRRYPDGQVRELVLTTEPYRALLRQAMPLAKARGDRSTYSAVTHALEGPTNSSPLSPLVGRNPDGRWVFLEELSESQP